MLITTRSPFLETAPARIAEHLDLPTGLSSNFSWELTISEGITVLQGVTRDASVDLMQVAVDLHAAAQAVYLPGNRRGSIRLVGQHSSTSEGSCWVFLTYYPAHAQSDIDYDIDWVFTFDIPRDHGLALRRTQMLVERHQILRTCHSYGYRVVHSTGQQNPVTQSLYTITDILKFDIALLLRKQNSSASAVRLQVRDARTS